MLSVHQALERLLAEVPRQPLQWTDLRNAPGRVLARPIDAPRPSPPFDNSAMDGFAVRAGDLASATPGAPVTLDLLGEIIAGGDAPPRLTPGKTLRINTGAPLPEGADCVVQIENVTLSGDDVTFASAPEPGLNVRRAGEDYRAGDRLLEPGRRLTPPAVGLLASLGVDRVPVARRPRVALIASGNELVEPGAPLGHGQIYDSTRFALLPMLASFGAEVHDLGRVSDTPEATRRALSEGLEFDALITTGGVSMGTHDFIRPTLIELGAKEIFWKVRQRPGKPLFIARRDSTLCFGLPGNPVSVFVTALLYVRASLLRMQGAEDDSLPWRPAIAGAEFKKKTGLTVFARADRAQNSPSGVPAVRPSSAQGSHQFSALSRAAGLVRLHEESSDVAEGSTVDFLDFGPLF